jgi:hypothetical protein
MTNFGYLTLEYIVGDYTYWLESDFEASPRFSFRVIPLNVFFDKPLNGDMHITGDKDYSEIKRTDEGLFFKSAQKDEYAPFAINLAACPSLSWSDAFYALVKAGVPLVDLTGFWHQNIVKGTDNAPDWVDKDKTYWVSAWLPDQDEPLYAVVREDYKLPENPAAVTVMCENREAFLERLSWFKVHAMSFVASRNQYWLV